MPSAVSGGESDITDITSSLLEGQTRALGCLQPPESRNSDPLRHMGCVCGGGWLARGGACQKCQLSRISKSIIIIIIIMLLPSWAKSLGLPTHRDEFSQIQRFHALE